MSEPEMKREKLPRPIPRALAERWQAIVPRLERPSPFGLTPEERQDFRGIILTTPMGQLKRTIKGLSVRMIDLSGADLDDCLIEECAFEDCLFDRTTMTRVGIYKSNFRKCSFRGTDLRAAGIGYGVCEFDACQFDRVRLSRTNFGYTIFRNMEILGRDWSHVFFETSGFWDCRFLGEFKDNRFYGDHRWDEDRQKYGSAKDTGFHNVDLTRAELKHWGFHKNWKFENVLLPESGTAFITTEARLWECAEKHPKHTKSGKVIHHYLNTFHLDSASNELILMSKHDLSDFDDVETCAQAFAEMKAASVVP